MYPVMRTTREELALMREQKLGVIGIPREELAKVYVFY